MPVEKHFSSEEIQKLFDSNSNSIFVARNKAFLLSLNYWGLERKEVFLLPLSSVMSEPGEWLAHSR